MTLRNLKIVWDQSPKKGQVFTINGKLTCIQLGHGTQYADGDCIPHSGATNEWLLKFSELNEGLGKTATRVRIAAGDQSFTFFCRDVQPGQAMVIHSCGVVVSDASETVNSTELLLDYGRKGLTDGISRLAVEPEETFEEAAKNVRKQHCPTWLGLSRDMRMFELDYQVLKGNWGSIRPRLPEKQLGIEECNGAPPEYAFVLGRGSHCAIDIQRRLEEGHLPILHSHCRDGQMDYQLTAMVDLEQSALSRSTVKGTNYLVAANYAAGISQTEEEKRRALELEGPELLNREEQTLLCIRIVMRNNGAVPGYSWLQAPSVNNAYSHEVIDVDPYQRTPGMGRFNSGRIYCVALVDGEPLPQVEVAILIGAGKEVVVDLFVPHQPIDEQRAEALLAQKYGNFPERLQRCRSYWKEKAAARAQLTLPETRIDEMFKAGLHHLDLITYGNEPSGTLAPTIGRYAPIGTESAPIIQAFDAVGQHDIARRCLNYFIEKQRPNGQMQNYNHYQAETGPVLWSIGEHYRYTGDTEWVKQIAPAINKACDFLIKQCRDNDSSPDNPIVRNLISGAVADPEEETHYFMNSGYACLGLFRAAEMLEATEPERASELTKEAEALKENLLAALRDAIARGPVIPLEDGTWTPSVGPFVEANGALSLLADRNAVLSHGSFFIHDSAIGPLYLILQEVLDANEPLADQLLRAQQRMNTERNVGPSQPYYCRHDYAHIRRGEVNAFLKCYYNSFAALADRETYTFWEHLYAAGLHKTHEEAWFLLQTRWMLLIEEGNALKLLSAIPRRWMTTSDTWGFQGMASYFGKLDITVDSQIDAGVIRAQIRGADRTLPKKIGIRLPHPDQLRACECSGGDYDAATETVWIHNYNGEADIRLEFS